MNLEIVVVDYSKPQHARDLGYLLNCYALDPMGGGKALAPGIQEKVAAELGKVPTAFSVMCYANGTAAGLINCFFAFSSFQCKPLVNIHDVVVLEEFRGQHISQLMLNKVEDIARAKGCGKLTLEVLAGNTSAQQAYRRFGFTGYELDPKMGNALFWQKPLTD